jgi:O-acetyl-ADP-ribose deacetylase
MPLSNFYRIQVNQTTLELIQGDITQQDVDAIVNAANSYLLGGGGVDGAIHRAAGPELLTETRALGGCQTGDAKITGGYNLKARYVIHAVGPIYQRGNAEVAGQLASAYRRSLEVAQANHIRSVAFPSISTGAYGYPLEEASHIALQSVSAYLMMSNSFSLVRFVLFNEEILEIYTHTLKHLVDTHKVTAGV